MELIQRLNQYLCLHKCKHRKIPHSFHLIAAEASYPDQYARYMILFFRRGQVNEWNFWVDSKIDIVWFGRLKQVKIHQPKNSIANYNTQKWKKLFFRLNPEQMLNLNGPISSFNENCQSFKWFFWLSISMQ